MTQKHPLAIRILHFVSAVFIFANLTIAPVMKNMQNSAQKWQLYSIHKTIGVLFVAIILMRIFFKISTKKPEYPLNYIKKWEEYLSKVVQYLLYVAMFFVPISGYLMSNAGGYDIFVFGLKMPAIISQNANLGSFFANMHGSSCLILFVLLTLHIAGFLKHLIIDKKNLLNRII